MIRRLCDLSNSFPSRQPLPDTARPATQSCSPCSWLLPQKAAALITRGRTANYGTLKIMCGRYQAESARKLRSLLTDIVIIKVSLRLDSCGICAGVHRAERQWRSVDHGKSVYSCWKCTVARLRHQLVQKNLTVHQNAISRTPKQRLTHQLDRLVQSADSL